MDCDFLVIGGGIAGVSAAARLASEGRVIVVEAEAALAHHASGRSAALYEPRYGLAPVVALSLASEAYFRGAEGVLSPRGLMVVARADQEAEFAAEIAGFGMERISVQAARAMVPILGPEVALAAFADHAWDIDTDLLLQGFLRIARGHGAELRLKAPVSAIARVSGGWEVTAGGEVITARRIVNAAGAWVDQVAVMAGLQAIGFTPYRRSMARIPAPGGLDVSGWPMLFGCGESWYAKPDAGALIVSPAEEELMEPHDAWADDMVLAEGLARYEAMVSEPVTRLISSWAGLRTFAPDRVLCLGPDPLEPDFIWSAGQGGYGFQTSPAASELVADLALGRAPSLSADMVAALRVDRFR
ncbi:FAD-binding oxidoreductase [Rhodobacter sp. KR11]|uniref:NAD(P)/FAD-dependent oxidoreductase n=1 Tax=Rhodobacter sp. KR11 TaxID=2974588 RepID=UPI0022226AF8|nr:FAD-dependent oxidoreductase [Rhodobacter sp. KR11]MCW1917300.1 FAD-binding oxidoreductase [Rhodobacter sp. KR11]